MTTNKHVIVIAEAGVNHNGSMDIAKRLIDAAVDAGADFVKFQTFKAEKIASKKAQKAAYQLANLDDGSDTQFEMLKRLELSEQQHFELQEYCTVKGIKFLSTPFDVDSISFLSSMGITIGKVPSGELTHLPYLKKMAATFKEIILSTGMADLGEIEDTLEVLLANGQSKDNITILHCNTEYPTPMKDVNLKAMVTLREHFGVQTGYSDHTKGIEVAIAAVALGAAVIEKHFTLDRTMTGPDHKASLEPAELKNMITAIRNIEAALGNGIKKPSESEAKNIAIARKSIVASAIIRKGELLTEYNITIKRPAGGISPMKWDDLLGTIAIKDFAPDDLIEI